MPGYISWGKNRTDTRWIPFLPPSPSELNLTVKDMDFSTLLDPETTPTGAGPAYTKMMVQGNKEELAFAANKIVLLIG